MEDEFHIKEIKIMEGVYIWKPEKKTNNDNKNNSNQNNNESHKNNESKNINNINLIGNKSSIGQNEYLCQGKDELIKIYEIEFEELGNKVLSLFQSNEDMMEYDPNDYDLIQAVQENLELIDKKLADIVKIQENMKQVCSYHPIVTVDIFEYFGIGKKSKEKDENKMNVENKKDDLVEVSNQNKNNKIENKINNINSNENTIKEENTIEKIPKDKIENDNEIITEIEL
jgi:hypothetical protein